jgi:hypothetical protein
MISLIDVCQKEFVSLIPTLDKFNNDLSDMDMLDNIKILLEKLRQRSSDDL